MIFGASQTFTDEVLFVEVRAPYLFAGLAVKNSHISVGGNNNYAVFCHNRNAVAWAEHIRLATV